MTVVADINLNSIIKTELPPLPELDAVDEDVNGGGASYMLADNRNTPLALYETAEVRECLTRSVDRLPERERQVVALYYVEELTMKEIGAVLGVTESRVSQIHTQAMIRLRNSLAPLRSSFATV